jgi:peptidyl-prolyl cis-trans isomerase SurA
MSILRKTLTTSFAAGLLFTNLNAQTLFTYGTQSVSKEEFLKAYEKNNAGEAASAESYRNYLELYTRFKLKVKAAKDLRLDTLSAQKAELQAFKMQVADNFMDDAATIDKLVTEAHERRKKEIHLAHIFIPVAGSATEADVKIANDKIQAAYKRLGSGESFESVAMAYSADPSVTVNKGDIGFITALTLNYELENLAYAAAVGTVSKPTRSQIGFHIFKNLGERPSSGRMRAAQILLAFTPGMTSAQKEDLKLRADSLHAVLKAGGDFKTLAARFSNDNITYQTGGEMMEFGVGTYEPGFENAAFALQNDGDLTTPD